MKISLVPDAVDGMSRADVADAGMKNVRSKNNPANTDSRAFVRNVYTGTDIQVTANAIRHGLTGNENRRHANSYSGAIIGDLVENAIRVNELIPRGNAERTYVMMAVGANKTHLFPTSLVVNEENEVVEYNAMPPIRKEYLVSANTKMEPAAQRARGLGDEAITLTDSTISIASLLDIVKDYYADRLSQNVLDHFGMERPKGTFSESVRFSLKDSEGRALTPEQAEFFKDSKIRDENGNLKVVYHNTTSDFTVFDRSYSRKGVEVDGFFFAPENDPYNEYGERVIEAYLNIKNPAINPKLQLGDAYDAGTRERIRLQEEGYDGIIFQDSDGTVEEYVAFYPEQIKLINNKKPTENPDIRFSLKDPVDPMYSKLQRVLDEYNGDKIAADGLLIAIQ